MPLEVKEVSRVFKHKDLELPDPGNHLNPEEVMNFYTNTYPELTTATLLGPEMEGEKAVYEFKTTVGTKG